MLSLMAKSLGETLLFLGLLPWGTGVGDGMTATARRTAPSGPLVDAMLVVTGVKALPPVAVRDQKTLKRMIEDADVLVKTNEAIQTRLFIETVAIKNSAMKTNPVIIRLQAEFKQKEKDFRNILDAVPAVKEQLERRDKKQAEYDVMSVRHPAAYNERHELLLERSKGDLSTATAEKIAKLDAELEAMDKRLEGFKDLEEAPIIADLTKMMSFCGTNDPTAFAAYQEMSAKQTELVNALNELPEVAERWKTYSVASLIVKDKVVERSRLRRELWQMEQKQRQTTGASSISRQNMAGNP